MSKYVSKPLDRQLLESLDLAQELLTAYKGMRLCSTFGTWRAWPITKRQGTFDPTRCKDVGKLTDIIEKGTRGDVWAQGIVAALFPDRTPRRFFKSTAHKRADAAQPHLPRGRSYQ